MSTQHTPGPWHTNGYSSSVTGSIVVYHKPFGLGDVAEVHDAADAFLIAAAPELLEALKACAAVCAGETSYKQGLVDALELARAAITKAVQP